MGARYLCADVGGTQIKAAVLEETGEPAGGIERFDACSGLPRDALLGHLAGCLAASAAGKHSDSIAARASRSSMVAWRINWGSESVMFLSFS